MSAPTSAPLTTTRRTFLGGSLAAAVAWHVAHPAVAEEVPLRAAVLEHTDQWTSATGLGELLRRAGIEVIDLDVTRPATQQAQQVDLIAFGAFTNNADPYQDFVTRQADSIREFVASGRVVLDMAQSDQFGDVVGYLPSGMTATLTDLDHDTIYPIDEEHPLVGPLRQQDGMVFQGRDTTPIRVSWETLGSHQAMRVLMACTAAGTPPCLLEGAHGDGRFLVSSLTVDKVFDASGAQIQAAQPMADSEEFFAALAAYVRMVRTGTAPDVVPTTAPAAGPLVGHVTDREARILIRPGEDHHEITTWALTVTSAAGTRRVTADISPDNDHTVLFDVPGLRAGTDCTFEISPDADIVFEPLTGSFSTAPPPNRRAKVTMGLGSCAHTVPNHLWGRVVEEGCDSFVMLGDTPYIDSTDLDVVRQKQRAFLMEPDVASVVSSMPVWGTWDDHDFGGNDVHGDLAGKRNNRTGFVDYRANASFGEDARGDVFTGRTPDGEGIYTSFRRGPVEVFLIDPRWFSRTAPSWADPEQPTCIGEAQWEWLQRGLRRSTAAFKVLASGMIWDDKQNSESDDWGTYAHERDAIFEFVRRKRIEGVLLLGGDIHVSRALNYGVSRVGYDLWQFIVSPIHHSTIASLNVPHPALVHSAVEPHVFLKLEADSTVQPATLTATWINRDGERVFEVATDADQMKPVDAWALVGTEGLAELVPGEEGEVTTSFTNNTTRAVTDVTATLQVPDGWTAAASTAGTVASVPAGETVETTWSVTPAADAAEGGVRVGVEVSYRSQRRSATVSAEASGTVLPAGTIPRSQMSVAGVSDEQGSEGPAGHAIDGNPSTYWHTRYTPAPVPFPHWIAIDLGASYDLESMGYLTRQGAPNGRIKDYRVFVSGDGQSWGDPVASGSFTGTDLVRVDLAGSRGRFLKLEGLDAQNGQPFGGAAEITATGRRV